MTYLAEPTKEYASAYFVEDRSNLEEIEGLSVQDKMLNVMMGGLLDDAIDPSHLRRVLDVGCGTGGWLIEMARTYPGIERLVGADINSKVLSYARKEAQAQQLDGRVQFQVMDALRMLECAPSSFDLVNQRFGLSWLRTWEWTKLLLEYQRVCRPGGIVRITEPNLTAPSSSPALTKLYDIALATSYRSGRLWTNQSDGVTSELARLMTQHGIEDVKSRVHTLVCRSGTEAGQYFYEDVVRFFHVALPFFEKWTRVPSDYQDIYQQAKKDMQQPDFGATMTLVTVWGSSSGEGKRLLMRGLR